jgi:uncharacterized protein YhfF
MHQTFRGNVPPHIAPFWQSFVETQAVDPSPRFFEAFHFDDNERSADELARLVLAGRKRATAGLVWSFEAASVPLPKVGDLSVVTNWAKTPLCVIETRRVDVIVFDEVSEEFAATEGEGDGSLRYWREAHWAYFGRECERMGRTREPSMPVVCERFEVIFRGRPEDRPS